MSEKYRGEWSDGGDSVLRGPNGFECHIDADCPEDHTWDRDGAPVVGELNRLAAKIARLEAQVTVGAICAGALRRAGTHPTIEGMARKVGLLPEEAPSEEG